MLTLQIMTALMGFTLVPLFEGWVLSTLWRWFLVPMGAPVISTVQAVGIDLCLTVPLIGLFPMGQPTDTHEQKVAQLGLFWGRRLVVLMVLGLGLVWRQFL
jgi:hypothetical protein